MNCGWSGGFSLIIFIYIINIINNMSDNSEVQLEATIIKLDTLEQNFNVLMGQYQEAKDKLINGYGYEAKETATVDALNSQLLDIANQYEAALSTSEMNTQKEVMKKGIQSVELKDIYATLMAERAKIDEMLTDYGVLDRTHDDNLLKTDQNNSQFHLWFAFSILIIFYLIKVFLLPTSDSNLFSTLFWISVFLLFGFTTFHINQSAGFLLWGTMIVFFSLAKMKIVPAP